MTDRRLTITQLAELTEVGTEIFELSELLKARDVQIADSLKQYALGIAKKITDHYDSFPMGVPMEHLVAGAFVTEAALYQTFETPRQPRIDFFQHS